MPSLLPHAFAVRSGNDLLVMDAREDDYALLVDAVAGPKASAPVLWPLGVMITNEAAEALAGAGLASEAPGQAAEPLVAPAMRVGASGDQVRLPSARATLDLLSAAREARRRMARGLPFRRFERTRAASVGSDPLHLDRTMAEFAAARLIIPTARRCLPASLVCALFLARRGIASEVVFGVRTHPFLAHCWVEVDGRLVDDEPERVAAYLPICVAAP